MTRDKSFTTSKRSIRGTTAALSRMWSGSASDLRCSLGGSPFGFEATGNSKGLNLHRHYVNKPVFYEYYEAFSPYNMKNEDFCY